MNCMIVQQIAQTHIHTEFKQRADSEGAWEAPKTLKRCLQRHDVTES